MSFRSQHQFSQPLSLPESGQDLNAIFHRPRIHGNRETALNPTAYDFISHSSQYQTSTPTPSGQSIPMSSGQTTPRAYAQTPAIHIDEQLHPGQGQSAPLPTSDELEQQISLIMSRQFNDFRSRLNALTTLQTQVLGFVNAKGREKAAISARLEQEQQRTSENSYAIVVMLRGEEKKRQEMFDVYGRKFIELGEAINETYGDLYFGSSADTFSGL